MEMVFQRGNSAAQEDGGRGVDGHGSRDVFKGDAVEEVAHVEDGVYSDPNLADLAPGERVIGVAAHLCGQVEGDRETGLAGLYEVLKTLVRLFGGAEPGVLAYGPGAATIHR